MTDNEIIKALECCGKNPPKCSECGYRGKCNKIDCYDYLKRDALDLINRQKAEIERLEANLKEALAEIEALKQINLHCKAETAKEFAKFLVDKAENGVISIVDLPDYVIEKGGKG